MARHAILFLLTALTSTACANNPPEDARRSGEAKRTTETIAERSTNSPETTAESGGANGGLE